VSGVLSYKFDEMDQASTRAKQYLAGEAVDQYDKSMQSLTSQIQSQKLQVTVNPVSVGVVRLTGDDARVLVFADQIGVRTDKQPAGGPTQFAMDMHRADGKWKIVKLDFFDGK
jgi:Mce-associated membrane protein